MKKFISLFLSLLMVFSLSLPAFADDFETNAYPVIVVPGYSSSSLIMHNGDGTDTKVWGLDFDNVFERVKNHAAEIALGLGLSTADDFRYLARLVGEEFIDLAGSLACDSNGVSINDIDVFIPPTARASRWSNLADTEKSETVVMQYVQEYVSDDDIYNFTCDFRLGAVDNAKRLDALIRDITETTGCEKVNLLCISHGGQVAGTYLSLFGTEGYVNNCVMCMPAMGGAGLAYDILSGNAMLDEKTLMTFIEYGMEFEDDWHWIFEAIKLDFLDDFIAAFLPYAYEVIGNWASIWDFVPLDYFDDMVTKLDPDENRGLIETTTWFHENIMAKYGENLNAAKNAGVNITILTGCGMPVVTGLGENSDAIIRTADTTGAKCAPMGQRFSDGYTCVGTACSNPLHNHLSPSMEIDASVCWLPDNTWFVDGLYHGMELFDKYTMDIVVLQLLGDKPMEDVYADEAYSQFHAASAKSSTLWAAFDSSREGYLSSEDSALIVKNTTAESRLVVFDVSVEGADIEFEDFYEKTIKPGDTASFTFTGDLPEESLSRVWVTVTYVVIGSYTPIGSRTLDFTLMNGDPAEYDEASPLAPVDCEPEAVNIPDEELANAINGTDFARLFNAISKIMAKLVKFVKTIVEIIVTV